MKPLRRQIATSLAGALTSICCRWGPPDKIRMDNGTEFQTAPVRALFAEFGVRVKRGAAHHPQSQGGVERMNRTLIMQMRKVLDQVSDRRRELDLLLFYYIPLPYSSTKVSPMHAMCGWKPRSFVLEACPGAPVPSKWVEKLNGSAAHVCDVVETELSASSPPQPPHNHTFPVMPYCTDAPGVTRSCSRHLSLAGRWRRVCHHQPL